ncbi:MAG TPA: cob(I)yrinic acid a,c-diamide adenosyltransferase [Candidatus Merdenecus merdavium]|nr:cob(I)yrinic acid a,c-diamide adenosyltransferase [Candidatus Merdenecus merdavium]
MKGERGLIHIYYGDGKGKTTTGMGLSMRASGAGLKVLIYQFMKDNHSSERRVLKLLPGVTVIDGLLEEKFSFQMSLKEKEERKRYYEEKFQHLVDQINREHYDLLFLDEVIYTIRAGLFEEETLLSFLKNKPEHLEVVLTGNEPSERLIDLADYVSMIKKVKHPFDQGIVARIGIEK